MPISRFHDTLPPLLAYSLALRVPYEGEQFLLPTVHPSTLRMIGKASCVWMPNEMLRMKTAKTASGWNESFRWEFFTVFQFTFPIISLSRLLLAMDQKYKSTPEIVRNRWTFLMIFPLFRRKASPNNTHTKKYPTVRKALQMGWEKKTGDEKLVTYISMVLFFLPPYFASFGRPDTRFFGMLGRVKNDMDEKSGISIAILTEIQ